MTSERVRKLITVFIVKFRNVTWFTNLDHAKRQEELILYKQYSPKEYPTYDNYDAIEVSQVKNIPADWDGVMGFPVTFLDKCNPEQFEIVGSNRGVGQDPEGVYGRGSLLSGKETWKRLLIRHRRSQTGRSHSGRSPSAIL